MTNKKERIVIKMGTQIVLENGEFAKARLTQIISTCHSYREKKKQFLFVSSGAVGLGRSVLKLGQKLTLEQKQACAAVGQGLLMDCYRDISTF